MRVSSRVSGREAAMMTTTPTITRRWRPSGAAALVATACLAVAILTGSQVASASHGEPFGTNFGIGPAAGAALAGQDDAFWIGACDLEDGGTANGGVGVAPAVRTHCIDPGGPSVPCFPNICPPVGEGYEDIWEPGQEPAWRLDPFTRAGGHPDLTTMFWLNHSSHASPFGPAQSDGDPKTVIVKLPPGIVGNPNAIPKCTSEHLDGFPNTCPPETQIGVSLVITGSSLSDTPFYETLHPVYNVEARDGKTAEIFFSPQPSFGIGGANIPIVASARTDDDYGIDAVAINLPGGIPVQGQVLTLWGVPWAASHDKFRAVPGYRGHKVGPIANGGMPETGLAGGVHDLTGAGALQSQEAQPYDPAWGTIKPFLTQATECAPSPQLTTIQLASWQSPDQLVSTADSADAMLDGCADLPFEPDIALEPTSSVADSATGLSVDLTLPQNNDPPVADQFDPDDDTGAPAHWKSDAGLGTAHLDKAVVTLPEGVSLNPSGAAGLQACSDALVGLVQEGPARFDNDDPFDEQGDECPQESKIGTAGVYTPLLPGDPGEPNLTGEVVLGAPQSTDPESGDMFRLFVVVRNRQRGVLAKLAGSAIADEQTGRLTTTFDKSPRVPFETVQLDLKGGPRGLLAQPQRCGAHHGWSTLFIPWTAAHGGGGTNVPDGGTFDVGSRCGYGFAPSLTTGMDNRQGGGNGSFSFRFARSDGEQWFASGNAELPAGLAAKLKGLPKCSDAQAAAGACPLESRIGTVDAGGGSGAPFFLEKKGSAYLTEGYKGAPLGLAVVVPVEAGPFRGQFALDTIVVRQALFVNPNDASVTAVSDPFPRIWHGIPLRVREATLKIDRPGFMVNPTDCSAKQIVATLLSVEGVAASPVQPFRATGCSKLGFKPKLAMRLVGRRQRVTGKHPGVRVAVRQPAGQAGIKRALARLPRSLALDPDNARALCEFEDGTRPDLERHCPRGSIIGRARAVTPLLNKPLVGNVYFVKNIRRDPKTGNEIRTLPMIIVALRGEIAINLRGVSSTARDGRLINTFHTVPDAPVRRFNLSIRGGSNGVLAVTGSRRGRINLCRGRHIAQLDIDGHNGRRADRDIRVKTPCPKGRPTNAPEPENATHSEAGQRRP